MNFLAIILVILGFALILAIGYGRSKAKEKQAERDADALLKDNEISVGPYIDNPLDGLLDKKPVSTLPEDVTGGVQHASTLPE